MEQRTSRGDVELLDGGLFVAAGGSGVADDEETMPLVAQPAEVGGASDARLGTSVVIGVDVAMSGSARGVGLSVAEGAGAAHGPVTPGASCWRSLVNCAR